MQLTSAVRAAGYRGLAFFELMLAEAYSLGREYDAATQVATEHLAEAEQRGMRFQIGWANRILGEIALQINPAQREPPLAAPHFERSIAVLGEIDAQNELALAYAGYGRLHARLGEPADARRYLTAALEIFEGLGTLIEPERVRQALAELPRETALATARGS